MKLYELKNKIRDYNEELEDLRALIISSAENKDGEGVKRAKENIETIRLSRDTLVERLNEIEAEERAREKAKEEEKRNAVSNEELITRDLANFYRTIAKKQKISEGVRRNLFGDNTTQASGGENLLPTQLSTALIHKPFEKNPLREIMSVSNITGLELAKVAYTLDDDEFIKDGSNAKEGDLTAEKISFGRYKFKISARVSDTIMLGTDTNLVQYIQNALESGLAKKEKKQILGTNVSAGQEHMSLYHTNNGIKEIEVTDIYQGIKKALGDLKDEYLENTSIVMKRSDYYEMIEKLANTSVSLYGVQPNEVFGYPIIFSDMATKPIIGDFKKLHLNYENPITLKSDEQIQTGDTLFVLTAWADIRIIEKDAFRILKTPDVYSTTGINKNTKKSEGI